MTRSCWRPLPAAPQPPAVCCPGALVVIQRGRGCPPQAVPLPASVLVTLSCEPCTALGTNSCEAVDHRGSAVLKALHCFRCTRRLQDMPIAFWLAHKAHSPMYTTAYKAIQAQARRFLCCHLAINPHQETLPAGNKQTHLLLQVCLHQNILACLLLAKMLPQIFIHSSSLHSSKVG